MENFLLKPPKPILYFNDIEINKNKSYLVILYDFIHFDLYRAAGKAREYIVFPARLIKGFEELKTDYSLTFRMHFPRKSFEVAWNIVEGYEQFDESQIIDCFLEFKRLSKKKMRIVRRKYYESGEYNLKKAIEEFSRSKQPEQED